LKIFKGINNDNSINRQQSLQNDSEFMDEIFGVNNRIDRDYMVFDQSDPEAVTGCISLSKGSVSTGVRFCIVADRAAGHKTVDEQD